MSFIMVKYFHLCEHSSHSFQPIFNGKSVINDVLDPTYLRCGYFILWLILCQGFSTVTSVTGHSNHQITITWITCNQQSALPQIHTSHRHSSYGLPFTTPTSSQTQCALTCVYLPFSDSRPSSSHSPMKLLHCSRSPPILQRQSHISKQLRLSGPFLSPRLSPAICSSYLSINPPVILLNCCV